MQVNQEEKKEVVEAVEAVEAIVEAIGIPENTEVFVDGSIVKVKGKLGENSRRLENPLVKITKEGNKVVLRGIGKNKNTKKMINTFKAHISNLIKGVNNGFAYKMRICSGHFPISVKVEKDQMLISNFLGEKIPRTSRIMPGVKAEVNKEIVTINGIDLESVSQTAQNIERATKIKGRDRRVFQDGIYLISRSTLE